MKCKDCNCCHLDTLSRWSNGHLVTENVHLCYGVKEPFVIQDIEVECTEYEDIRNKTTKPICISAAINHFNYGISHDIFSEPVTSYAKMAVEALKKQIPVQPLTWENKYYYSPTPNDDWGYECPCCGNQEIDYPEHHCTCGQALDWDWH